MKKNTTLEWIVAILLIIGGLDMGIIGLWNFDVLGMLFGPWPRVLKLVYVLVGLSALYEIYVISKRK